jgi:hypothetical protein
MELHFVGNTVNGIFVSVKESKRSFIYQTLTVILCQMVDSIWNVMAGTQKQDFVFERNGR